MPNNKHPFCLSIYSYLGSTWIPEGGLQDVFRLLLGSSGCEDRGSTMAMASAGSGVWKSFGGASYISKL